MAFPCPPFGAWQLNGAQANLGVWFSRRGKVRGDPCNALLGLGATKRRGVLSMTERHLGTLPLKDVGKKDPDKQLEGNPNEEWS